MWLTFSSSVMPMPPWSCTDSWLTWRQASADPDLRRRHHAPALRRVRRVDLHAREVAHGARLLVADHHVDHAVLQRLEAPDGHAELTARLEVVERRVVGVADGAHRLRAQERGGVVGDLLDEREPRPLEPEQRVAADSGTPAKLTSAARCSSMVRNSLTVTPGAFFGPRERGSRPGGRCQRRRCGRTPPARRRRPPWSTTRLSPSRMKPSPVRRARRPTWARS